jgi:hypothetical protein
MSFLPDSYKVRSGPGVSAQPLVPEATGLNQKEITITIKAEFKEVN